MYCKFVTGASMFCEIENLFSGNELAELLAVASESHFVDGRISNPANTAKSNLQLHDPDAYARSARIISTALFRDSEFVAFAFPKTVAPPMITKYEIGMNYGAHSDAAFIPLGQRPLRTDLSITIFLSDPANYDGGELVVQLGSRALAFKGAAGSAIIYPSNTMHQVMPVRRGTRIAAISFIESQVPNLAHRELLFELNEVAARIGLHVETDVNSRLGRVQSCLTRMWSDPH
jgi:PKHD-type hydroxylase